MKFPLPDDFLEEFGIFPDCVNENDVFFQYSRESAPGGVKIVISFSAIAESFQVCVSIQGSDALIVSSEKVSSISLFRNSSQAGVLVEFSYQGLSSEAKVVLEPEIKVNWWVLAR